MTAIGYLPGRGGSSSSAASPALGCYVPPTGILYETMPRQGCPVTTSVLTSGQVYYTAINLPSGLAVTKISFAIVGSGLSSQTHWWFALYDQNRAQLAVTADQLTATWDSFTRKTLNIAKTAAGTASSFTTTYAGTHYIGVMATGVAGVTLPCFQMAGGMLSGEAPIIASFGDSAQTSPPAFPHTVPSGGGATYGLWGGVG